jgi:hypothetical protein
MRNLAARWSHIPAMIHNDSKQINANTKRPRSSQFIIGQKLQEPEISMVLRVPFKPFHFNSLIRIMMLDLKDYSQ